MIKLFHPETWLLEKPTELWVNKNANIQELNNTIAKHFDISEECILLTKINSPWSFHRVILPFQEWVNISDANIKDSYLHSSPFYLSTDGILFILRDSRQNMREMTAEEKALYHCDEFES